MLIEKRGDRPARLLVDVHNLREQFEARIQNLANVVGGVVAMLADEHNAIYGEATCRPRSTCPEWTDRFESRSARPGRGSYRRRVPARHEAKPHRYEKEPTLRLPNTRREACQQGRRRGSYSDRR